MKNILALILVLFAIPALSAPSDGFTITKSKKGYGTKGYQWNKMTTEQMDILAKAGDIARGREAFRVCRGCHKPDGSGISDGTYPRLTGQHATVTIKEVADTRAGIRVNPKMEPFANEHAVSPQEIADIAVFLQAERTTKENGKGPGDDVARGKQVYEMTCARCHGDRGEGSAEDFYPAVASQHYGYLLRELNFVKKGLRGNSHPKMVRALQKYSDDDMEALADYMSRMPDFHLSEAHSGEKK